MRQTAAAAGAGVVLLVFPGASLRAYPRIAWMDLAVRGMSSEQQDLDNRLVHGSLQDVRLVHENTLPPWS